MPIPSIDWSAFSWEAFATLATGGAAVGAAWWVGSNQLKVTSRQTEISDGQSRILQQQVGLDELKVRTDLFERRYVVYQKTRDFLAAIMTSAAEPSPAVQHEFLVALDQARFLYRDEVRQQLDEIWKRACGFFAVKSVMTAQYDRTGDYGKENVEREYEALLWLNAKLESLSELFGDELKLSIPPVP